MNDEYKQMSWEEIYEFNKKLDNMEHDYKNKCKQLETYKNAVDKVIGLIYDYQMNDKDNSNYEEMLYFLKNIGSDK